MVPLGKPRLGLFLFYFLFSPWIFKRSFKSSKVLNTKIYLIPMTLEVGRVGEIRFPYWLAKINVMKKPPNASLLSADI
jgi:hypothetical protein